MLIFFTPVLADVALQFGPSELFWVAVLGVTVIGSLGTTSVLKGLFAGAFGLWISTVGYNPVVGEERFVFSEHLTGGINIIAALIGLFAIPQVLTMLEESGRSSAVEMFKMEQHKLLASFRANLLRVKALIIGTITGVIVGIIPGAGGQIAGLIAYDQTKKFSRHKDRFGKGEPDGVISAESANNAMVGPSLVPLLTLSVPGKSTMSSISTRRYWRRRRLGCRTATMARRSWRAWRSNLARRVRRMNCRRSVSITWVNTGHRRQSTY